MSLSRRRFVESSALLTAAALSGSGRAAGTDPAIKASRGRRGGKPNILLVVLDDVGFGDLGCYGSEVPTPCMDRLAASGLRYNNFHVSSLCAPTRASLMTGMNAHAAGVGNIAEWGRDHPGYRGWIRNDVRTLPELLSPSGYRSYAVGKWHLSPVEGRNATGPFDQWPTGRGFDHWYGFLGAAADHWHPELFRNRHAVYPDKSGGYHLTEDLVDQSIDFIRNHVVASADVPFFLYLSFGACHFPYHVPPDYMARHRGGYDAGWDAVRAERFARQQAMGIAPANAELAPRNAGVPAWDDISDDERRFGARTQEAYAGFVHHTDDFSEIHDRAAESPDRVADMTTLWYREAERNNVLPLEDDLLSLEADVAPSPRSRYVFFPGATRVDRRSAPDIFNHNYTITAEVEFTTGRANGVLLASGDSMAGYELLMRDGYLEYIYVFTRGRHYSARIRHPVPAGRHVLTLRGRKTSASSGRVELFVDGQASGGVELPRMWEVKSLNAGIRCGENRGAPISRLYGGAFRFDQTLERLTVELEI